MKVIVRSIDNHTTYIYAVRQLLEITDTHTLPPLKNAIFSAQYFSIFEHLSMNGHVLRLQIEEQPPIWRVVVTILIKQSRTADKGWSPG